jgi:hypothetical protein
VPSKSPQVRSLVATIGARSLHSQYDSRELTKNARAKFDQRFVDEVDPDRVLPEAERLRRAEHARKAYFARLALASAQARRARKAAK